MMKRNTKISAMKISFNLLLILISLACIIPLLYIVAISFTDERQIIFDGYRLIPRSFSTLAYEYTLKNPRQILTSYGVSIFVTVFGSIFSLLITSMLAYPAARRDFRYSNVIAFLVFFPMLFNVGLVPSYILITRYYNLKDSILVLILPMIVNSWHVFLMKGFLGSLPLELIESAKIDGSSEVNSFFRIVMPLSKPALATVGLFCAFMYWNDWWLAMLYIDSARLVPIQFLLYRTMNNIQYLRTAMQMGGVVIDTSNLPNETARMAMCVLATAPMLFVFPFFQKYFIKGLTIGALKG